MFKQTLVAVPWTKISSNSMFLLQWLICSHTEAIVTITRTSFSVWVILVNLYLGNTVPSVATMIHYCNTRTDSYIILISGQWVSPFVPRLSSWVNNLQCFSGSPGPVGRIDRNRWQEEVYEMYLDLIPLTSLNSPLEIYMLLEIVKPEVPWWKVKWETKVMPLIVWFLV